MVTTIPVPIEFSLPDGWQAAPPDEVGAPEAAFVALRPPGSDGFTPNITISGDVHPSDRALTAVAEDSLARLADAVADVRLSRRNEVGSPDNPGLTQTVHLEVTVRGRPRSVLQLQVYIAMQDTGDPARRVVLEVALTAAEEQFSEVVDDFQRFLETVRPDGGAQAG